MKLYIMRHCDRNLNNCSFESPLIDKGHLNAMDSCNIMIKNNITKIIYISVVTRKQVDDPQ